MTVKLVSTNDHPRPSILDERHEAEWLQRFLDNEQAEATKWSELFAFGFGCFGAGCLFTAAVDYVWRVFL